MPQYLVQSGDEQYCAGCTACCRWPGQVLFDPESLAAVAACLGLDERSCADTFFELHDDRRHLKTKPTMHGGCVFLDDKGCRVYAARPRQCRTFPYEWQRDEEELMRQCKLHSVLKYRAVTSAGA